MTTGRSAAGSRWRRGLAVLLGAAAVMTLAAGPPRIASALGLRADSAATGTPVPGFLPEQHTVEVKSPHVVLHGLFGLDTSAPIALAGGASSPSDTVLLEFSAIQLDDLSIVQNGPAGLAILNHGSGPVDGAFVGTPNRTTTYLWGEPKSLCMNLGDVLGLLSPALRLLVQAANGACLPISRLLPLLGPLINKGTFRDVALGASNLDIDVFALRVDSTGADTVVLPHGDITVGSS
jgi:hypothetical protein